MVVVVDVDVDDDVDDVLKTLMRNVGGLSLPLSLCLTPSLLARYRSFSIDNFSLSFYQSLFYIKLSLSLFLHLSISNSFCLSFFLLFCSLSLLSFFLLSILHSIVSLTYLYHVRRFLFLTDTLSFTHLTFNIAHYNNGSF